MVTGLALALLPAPSARAQTAAGTSIRNTASASFRVGDGETTARSNENVLVVAERLDVALAFEGAPPPAPAANQTAAVPVLLTNGGNGGESFLLDASVPTANAATVQAIAVDRDADGRYDPLVDSPLDGARTPALPPGAGVRLFVLLTGTDAAPAELALTVTARAATGSGAAGTVFAGGGDGGGDAVTGTTGAAATIQAALVAEPADLPTLVKTQTVAGPDGGTTPQPDAVVTYTLAARFPAATTAARIDDPLPEGTRYVAGSLRLDGAALSDAADGDAGSADGTAIRVLLGDVPASALRTVQFQVTLQ
ncbi:hypothetical protein ACBY01_00355 [Sphingomonas sp. ac-8]|uniref:hypothetical protein n=1 Tax=Sphingomonas sp. ac-8 TaxID=3242977 RepID=UPI003A80C70D